MKLIEYLPEPGFEFERAFVGLLDGRPWPFAVIGECDIDTKETLLDIGVAVCQPVDSKWAENWPISVVIETDEGDRMHLGICTADPKVVAAARRFLDLILVGEARPGMPL